jgi:hypothetical protein
MRPVGPVGYVVGYPLNGDQPRIGLSVVADSVNPLALTREASYPCGSQLGVRFATARTERPNNCTKG